MKDTIVTRLLTLALVATGTVALASFISVWIFFYAACFVDGDSGWEYSNAGFVSLFLTFVTGAATAGLFVMVSDR